LFGDLHLLDQVLCSRPLFRKSHFGKKCDNTSAPIYPPSGIALWTCSAFSTESRYLALFIREHTSGSWQEFGARIVSRN